MLLRSRRENIHADVIVFNGTCAHERVGEKEITSTGTVENNVVHKELHSSIINSNYRTELNYYYFKGAQQRTMPSSCAG